MSSPEPTPRPSDRATTPTRGEALHEGDAVLRRRADGVLELRVNGVFVMDEAETASERLLASTALAAHAHPATVLVGGLGLGFTARAVLDDPRVRRLEVVEREPALATWLAAGLLPVDLTDVRLHLRTADVRDAVTGAAPGSVDLLLLDVDNGPDFLVHPDNADLYAPAFLAGCARVLRPGGLLCVWSMADSPALRGHLAAVLDDVGAEPVDVRLQGRAETYWLLRGRARPGDSLGP